MATMIVSVPDMISKTGTTRKSWEAKVKRCKRKIPTQYLHEVLQRLEMRANDSRGLNICFHRFSFQSVVKVHVNTE